MTSPTGPPLALDLRLRIVAFVEATTLLVVVGGIVVRRTLDGPDLGPVLGPIHGLAFLTYVVAVIFAREDRGWSGWWTAGLVLAAIVPFGGYLVGHRLAVRATADPLPRSATAR